MRRWTLPLLLATLCSLSASQTLSAATKPHVLLIMTDDMGWMDLRCQGNKKLHTPHIDRLAKQGVRFTDAYAAAPVCSPTRAAIMTGLAPARLHLTQHGADGPQFWPKGRKIQPPKAKHVLSLETVTLAERMKQAGYATGFFGKWHLSGRDSRKPLEQEGSKFWPEHQGFDINIGGCGFGGPPTYFDPYRIPSIKPRKTGEYLTDRLADETIAYMKKHRDSRDGADSPMFICLWTYNPHYPFEAPADLVAKYKGKLGPGLKNAVYGAQLEATDRAIGRVLQAVDDLGLREEMLVLFTSDNGGWSGATDNRPLRSGKGDLYEGGLRVPLIARWPGVSKAGIVNTTPVISMDLTATILDAAGVSATGEGATKTDGQSLRRVLAGKPLEREAIYFHYPHFAWHRSNRPGAAIRAGQYKLIRRFDDDSVELFDLDKDLGERKDLSDAMPQRAERLNQRLTAWLKETNAGLPTPITK